MNPNVKQQWVQTLTNGSYKQHYGNLRSDNRQEHCVIGVLVDLHRKSQTDIDFEDWAGSPDYFVFVDGIGATSLDDLNDAGVSFNILADIIQEQL